MMIRYADKTRQEALSTYAHEGLKAACEKHHLPSSTIYRWLAHEKREAMLSHVVQECIDEGPLEDEVGICHPEGVIKPETEHRVGADAVEKDTVEQKEEIPDMLTLLTAENEKLRTMNLQLRKALQAFVQ